MGQEVIISLCIPVHARMYDLKKIMPHLIEVAKASPPVEIVILDYNSPDDLEEYIKTVESSAISYIKYNGRDYYHMAHARNLSVRCATGEYIMITSADIYPDGMFLDKARQMINDGCIWMHASQYTGVIVCEREEFISAGGYDERFEFYGPEDTELDARLKRRGGKFGFLPNGLLHVIKTPNSEKVKNYRLPLSKREMHQRMKLIYEENNRAEIMVANQDKEWGQP